MPAIQIEQLLEGGKLKQTKTTVKAAVAVIPPIAQQQQPQQQQQQQQGWHYLVGDAFNRVQEIFHNNFRR